MGDSFSLLLFVAPMMPHNYARMKSTRVYEIYKSQKKQINNPMYLDDIKIFAKNEKEQDILIQPIRIY